MADTSDLASLLAPSQVEYAATVRHDYVLEHEKLSDIRLKKLAVKLSEEQKTIRAKTLLATWTKNLRDIVFARDKAKLAHHKVMAILTLLQQAHKNAHDKYEHAMKRYRASKAAKDRAWKLLEEHRKWLILEQNAFSHAIMHEKEEIHRRRNDWNDAVKSYETANASRIRTSGEHERTKKALAGHEVVVKESKRQQAIHAKKNANAIVKESDAKAALHTQLHKLEKA